MTRSAKASRYLWVLTKISIGNAAESLCLSRKIGTFSTVTVANPTRVGCRLRREHLAARYPS
jgi:hypothetical protein